MCRDNDPMSTDPRAKFYPEISRFDSPEEARAVLRSWQKHLMKQPRFWLALCGYVIGVACTIGVLMEAMRRWVQLPAALYGGIIGGVIGGSAMLAVNWLWRSKCRRFLRHELIARGVAICLKCGYDLRGQTTPRCPECGTAANDPG